MKKIFMAMVLCLVCTMSFGQYNFSSENFVVNAVNEFGEEIGETIVGIRAKGYFSNSATTNSCANFYVKFIESDGWFSLYEYCGSHASHDSFRATFIGTKTKKEVIAINDISLEFIRLCLGNDTINVKLRETSTYGTTTAVFRLFKCKDFYKKYVKQFGEEKLKEKLIEIDEKYYRNNPPTILPLSTTVDKEINVFDLVPNKENIIHITKYSDNISDYIYYKSYSTKDKTFKFNINEIGKYKVEVITQYSTKTNVLYIK